MSAGDARPYPHHLSAALETTFQSRTGIAVLEKEEPRVTHRLAENFWRISQLYVALRGKWTSNYISS